MTSSSFEHCRDSRLTCRVLAHCDAMEAVADDWRALEAKAADGLTYFQGFDWCHRWIAAFGSADCQPVILTIWNGVHLVALLPLMQSGGRIRTLSILGAPHTQYANLLLDPHQDAVIRQEALALLRKALDGMSGHDVALFEHVPDGSPLAGMLVSNSPLGSRANTAAIFNLSDFATAEDYLARLNKKQRRNRTRRRNMLEQAGALSFDVLFPNDPAFAPALEECLRLKRIWLRETGRISLGLHQAGVDSFLASLAGNAEHCSGSCLSVLRVDGTLAAGELGFLHYGHYYAYLGAFDCNLSAASPGKLQMDMTIIWLIEKGISKYDLLGNESSYKEAWSNTALKLETHSLPSTFFGHAYSGLWIARLRPGLKHLYAKLPSRLRQLAQMAQSLGWLALSV